MRLSVETLILICESIAARGSLATAARAADIATSTLFKWIADSRTAAERGDAGSILHFEWRGKSDFAHKQFTRAKSEATLALLYDVVEGARHGTEQLLYDPSTNRPLQKLVPQTAHRSREWFKAQGLDYDIDRYVWLRDPLDDSIIAPVYETKRVEMPSAVKVKALAGLLPKVFGDKQTIDHNVAVQAVHRIEPASFRSRAVSAAPLGEVTDAEFTEVTPQLSAPPLRKDIEQLRAEAAELMRNGPKNPRPQGIVKDAMGQPVGRVKSIDDPPDDVQRDRPQRDLRDSPRAYEQPRPQPAPQRPPGNYPSYADPRRGRAMKIL